MRDIKYIAIHCSGTVPNVKIENIQAYWKRVRGWSAPGYHVIIKANGDAVQLLHFDKVSNGVAGYNSKTINICYLGGTDAAGKPMDTRTEEQKRTMESIVKELKRNYPNATILGHRDFPGVRKACPSFDVKSWLTEINATN